MRTEVDDLRECSSILEATVAVKVRECVEKFKAHTGREIQSIVIDIDGSDITVKSLMRMD